MSLMNIRFGSALLVLVLAWLILVGVSGTTLTISPTIWQDEVQIVEYGRTSLAGSNQGWGFNWTSGGQAKPLWSFAGAALQEKAFQYGNMAGVRWASIVGAILASLTLLGWLVSRRVVPIVALAAAALFLFDPLFTASYRGARVDALAMALMFAAFWLVHLNLSQEKWPVLGSQAHLVGAGVFVGLAGLVWTPFVLLLPLLVHEVFAKARVGVDSNILIFKQASVNLMVIALTAAVTMLLATVLFFGKSSIHVFVDLIETVTRQVGKGSSPEASFFSELNRLARVFMISPWLPLAAGVALILSRRLWLSLWVIFVFVVVLLTHTYTHRVIYVLPYLVLGIALFSDFVYRAKERPQFRPIWISALLVGLVLWAVILSLGARTWVAISQSDVRSPALITSLAETMIGEGGHKVYVEPWAFYYSGRDLGWQMYKWFDEPSEAEWRELASSMDYLIFSPRGIEPARREFLFSLGFSEDVLKLGFDAVDKDSQEVVTRRLYGKGFGREFVLFKRID